MPTLKTLFLLWLAATMATQAGTPPEPEGPTDQPSVLEVRAMSFNIKQHNPDNPKHKDSPTHWKLRKELVLEVIRSQSPDILGLQEAYRHQLDDLQAAFPGHAWVGEGRDGGERGEYCAILYRRDRFICAESGTFWLSDTPEKKSKTWGHFYFRICTWARLIDKKSGRGLFVFNTHLDHQSQPAREKSARLIARRLAERQAQDPFILMGDFNADEDNAVITYLTGEAPEGSPVAMIDTFRQLHPDATKVGTGNHFTGRDDGPKVDYIFVSKGAKVAAADIIRTHEDGRYPSDHFPLHATLEIPAP